MENKKINLRTGLITWSTWSMPLTEFFMIQTKTTYPMKKYSIKNLENCLRPNISFHNIFFVYCIVWPKNRRFRWVKRRIVGEKGLTNELDAFFLSPRKVFQRAIRSDNSFKSYRVNRRWQWQSDFSHETNIFSYNENVKINYTDSGVILYYLHILLGRIMCQKFPKGRGTCGCSFRKVINPEAWVGNSERQRIWQRYRRRVRGRVRKREWWENVVRVERDERVESLRSVSRPLQASKLQLQLAEINQGLPIPGVTSFYYTVANISLFAGMLIYNQFLCLLLYILFSVCSTNPLFILSVIESVLYTVFFQCRFFPFYCLFKTVFSF